MVIKLKRNYEGRNNNLREVGEPHEVAVGVDQEGGGEVTGSDKQQGGVHPEDCCVRELEHGDEKRGEDRFSLLDPLNHVVEVGHAKEEGTNNYCLGRGHFDKYSREYLHNFK